MGVALPFGDMGPCDIVWGYGESGAITISPFLGTVTLGMEDTIHDIQEEGYGEAPVDAVSGGAVVTLDIPMTRATVDQLEAVLNAAREGDILYLSSRAGCPMYADARPLLIRPVCDNVPSADPSTYILLYKTFPFRKFELAWDRSTQRVFLIGFKVFPNQDSGYVGKYLQIGVAEPV
jgi:hypothetical protein